MKWTDKIQVYNSDCLEGMKQMDDNQFDLAIVDPPYFDGPNRLGYYGGNISSSGVVRKGYKEIGSWQLPEKIYFNELLRVSKNQIIWGINYYAKYIESAGRIVWDKVNGSSSFSDCEIASTSSHYSVRMFSYMWNGMMQGKGIINGKTQEGNKSLNQKRIHPTEKPVKLYEWLLDNYAKEGHAILDTHGGSLSNAIACHNLGFNLTAYEIDSDYYEASYKRFKLVTAQTTIFD